MNKNWKEIDADLITDFNARLDDVKVKKISQMLHQKNVFDVSLKANYYHKLQPYFAIDLLGLNVTNQKQTGRCWLFALTNLLREDIIQNLHLSDFTLSNAYLAFFDKLERANFFLEAILNNKEKNYDDRLLLFLLENVISDGGQWGMGVNLVQKYGIVPQEVMADHYHAQNSDQLNYFLNWKLREYASLLLKTPGSYEQLVDQKNEMLRVIYKLLQTFYGTPPSIFDFEYQTILHKVDLATLQTKQTLALDDYACKKSEYQLIKNLTPNQFYNQFVTTKLDAYVSIIHAPSTNKPFYCKYEISYLNNVGENAPVCHYNVDLALFKYLILRSLYLYTKPVWFGADVSLYNDYYRGIWSAHLFDLNSLFGMDFKITKGDALLSYASVINHAMLLVGVNFALEKWKPISAIIKDEDGLNDNLEALAVFLKNLTINRWKVANSWGDSVGQEGYWIIDDDWFEKYVFQAVVLKKDLVMLLKTFKIPSLEQWKTQILPPWDPIGALAKNQ